MKERLFYDFETENFYTMEDIEKARQIAIADGDEYAVDSLASFLNACLAENNGSLTELKTVYSIHENGKTVFAKTNIYSDLF